MPKQFGILTDKGRINFGIIKLDKPTSAIGTAVQLPTDLRKFSGLPVEPINEWKYLPDPLPQDPPNFTCHLPNGNRITITTWRNTRLSGDNCFLTVEFFSKTQPDRGICNFPIYKNGNKSEIYEAGLYTYFPYFEYFGEKCTAGGEQRENWGPDETRYYIGQQLRPTNTIKADWFVKFTDGAIAPNFPGPDNEKDPAGGDGEGPDSIPDDPIEVPEEPPITASKSGLLTIYTPSASQLHDFGAFLWSDLFSLDTFKKLFADPMEAVIGLSVLPIAIPHTAGAESINIGQIDSNVFAFLATKQFVRHDCGEIKINPVWNTALDYSPYTKFSIFLPYIGTREIKADDIMGKNVGVTYMVDILSGSCTAHIKVNGTVLYQFSGSCAVPIPVTGSSWDNLLTSSIQLAGTGIAAAVTAGASTTVSAAASGLAIAGTAGLVANSKQGILRTGAVSGAAGMLGVQTPYIIRETMRQSLAKDYAHYYGYPSNITSLLGDLSGYTVVQACHLKNIDATGDELDEIERLLKDGVLL